MDKPGGDGATKQQVIDCYVEALAKVVGRLSGPRSFLILVMPYWIDLI